MSSDFILLSVRDVADRLNVCSATVLRMVKQGKLKALRITRGTIRFKPEDVEQLISEGMRTAAAPNEITTESLPLQKPEEDE
jgi:excisionase family DNA binding protein